MSIVYSNIIGAVKSHVSPNNSCLRTYAEHAQRARAIFQHRAPHLCRSAFASKQSYIWLIASTTCCVKARLMIAWWCHHEACTLALRDKSPCSRWPSEAVLLWSGAMVAADHYHRGRERTIRGLLGWKACLIPSADDA